MQTNWMSQLNNYSISSMLSIFWLYNWNSTMSFGSNCACQFHVCQTMLLISHKKVARRGASIFISKEINNRISILWSLYVNKYFGISSKLVLWTLFVLFVRAPFNIFLLISSLILFLILTSRHHINFGNFDDVCIKPLLLSCFISNSKYFFRVWYD